MTKGMSSEELRGSLLVEPFDRAADSPPPDDPITVMPMVVEIERIKPYDGNIRLVRNPKYDEIHHAIQTQGSEAAGVLPITRRPGEELYMIAKGGNTRLQILRHCWSETRESRFRLVQCLFNPWPGESKVLADHIAENENRGEMTFIEKALALWDLKQRMEQDGGEGVGLREFVRRLNDPECNFGLKVSLTQMHRFQYAAEFLYPLLPEALKAGLGASQLEKIHKLESTYAEYWNHRNPSAGTEPFRALFADVLCQHDGPDFVIELVPHAVESRLAEVLGRPLHSLQAEIAALAAGIDIGEPGDDIDIAAIAAASPTVQPLLGRSAVAPVQPVPPRPLRTGPAQTSSNEPPGDMCHPSQRVDETLPNASPLSLAALRARAYEAAWRLAQGRGLESYVAASPDCGLGYWIDLPEQSIADDAAAAALWWLLVGLSEQLTSLPNDSINHLRCLPAHNQLRGRVMENRWDEIHARVGRASSWIILPHLLQTSESDIEDLVLLFRTLRCLRAASAEAELWCIPQESS